MNINRRNSNGQVLVVVALVLAVLVGVAALAIDLGRAYGVKAKLNAAADAASYEAVSALGQGATEQDARAVGVAYFNANYPAGYLGSTPASPEISSVRDTNGVWKVTVSSTATMPTFFTGLLGRESLDIGTTSESVRETLDMVFVMDTSSSMKSVFGTVKTNSQSFVDLFNGADDRVGLVAFSTGAAPLVSICGKSNSAEDPASQSENCQRGFVKKTVEDAIGNLVSDGTTASEEGMKKALEQLNSLVLTARSGKKAIVFFSDGAPNTFNGSFPLATGGTVVGNLFSETSNNRPKTVYDPTKYHDSAGQAKNVASLPASGTDTSGMVPLASYDNKRSLSGKTDDDSLHCDVNRAARSMVENVANLARIQGITVFTLGLGTQLQDLEVTNCGYNAKSENGEIILKRLANTGDSDTYNSSQPSGIYCYAQTPDDLKPCFDKIAKSILRISK